MAEHLVLAGEHLGLGLVESALVAAGEAQGFAGDCAVAADRSGAQSGRRGAAWCSRPSLLEVGPRQVEGAARLHGRPRQRAGGRQDRDRRRRARASRSSSSSSSGARRRLIGRDGRLAAVDLGLELVELELLLRDDLEQTVLQPPEGTSVVSHLARSSLMACRRGSLHYLPHVPPSRPRTLGGSRLGSERAHAGAEDRGRELWATAASPTWAGGLWSGV